MQDKTGLELGTAQRGTPGRSVLVKNTTAADMATLRDTFNYKVDPIDGSTLIFPSIDAAVGVGRANLGDEILISSGYTEAISNATSLALDVAGLKLRGLGSGAARPTITLDTATTATVPVSAANVVIENVIMTANFADIVSFFTLTTANNFSLEGCYFKATAANMNCKYVVDTNTTTDDAKGLRINNCKWIEPDLLTECMVKMDGDNNDVTITNNKVSLGVKDNTPALMAIATAKSVFHADIGDNKVYRLNTDSATGGLLVTTDQSDNSGWIYRNYVQHADAAAEILVTASSGFGFFDNKASGVAGASGYLLPATDS